MNNAPERAEAVVADHLSDVRVRYHIQPKVRGIPMNRNNYKITPQLTPPHPTPTPTL